MRTGTHSQTMSSGKVRAKTTVVSNAAKKQSANLTNNLRINMKLFCSNFQNPIVYKLSSLGILYRL